MGLQVMCSITNHCVKRDTGGRKRESQERKPFQGKMSDEVSLTALAQKTHVHTYLHIQIFPQWVYHLTAEEVASNYQPQYPALFSLK